MIWTHMKGTQEKKHSAINEYARTLKDSETSSLF